MNNKSVLDEKYVRLMARSTTRKRVCISCDDPSHGPIKLLYYRWRLHGPFFPVLEDLRSDENSRWFTNGRAPVCTSCANYLQRQWNDYEKKKINLPVEKRTYRLLSDVRWEKSYRKKHFQECIGRMPRESINDDKNNENLQNSPSTRDYFPHQWKSRIPILLTSRRNRPSNKNRVISPEDECVRENGDNIRPSVNQMATEQTATLIRKLAEIKFQEEIDHVERKVQKTLKLVHRKSDKERIRDIELELEEKLLKSKEKSVDQEESKEIVPIEEKEESISDLRKHIKKEMDMQRDEMNKLRNNIKNEISVGMAENWRRNEEMRQLIKDMYAMKKGRSYQGKQNRFHSDGDDDESSESM